MRSACIFFLNEALTTMSSGCFHGVMPDAATYDVLAPRDSRRLLERRRRADRDAALNSSFRPAQARRQS
jgi:hypothetical protein